MWVVTFDFGLRIVLATGLAGMASVTLWLTATRWRAWRGDKWARRNLAVVAEARVPALDQWLNRRQRRGGALVLLAAVLVLVVPLGADGGPPLAMWLLLVAIGSIGTLLSATDLSRPFLVTGKASLARVKAVSVADYVSPRMRVLAWLSAGLVVADVAFLSVAAARQGSGPPWLLITVAAMVVLGLAVAEWAGRHLSERPEPAEDAADLYWQDAVRAEAIQAGFSGPLVWGVMVLTASPQFDPMPGAWVPFAVVTLVGSMLLGLGFVLASLDNMSMAWTRKRLWPELGPGEIVWPGQPLSASSMSGVTA